MQYVPPSWHSWNQLTETELMGVGTPVQVVNRPLALVGRPGSKGSSGRQPPRVVGSLLGWSPHEMQTSGMVGDQQMWLKDHGDQLLDKKIGWREKRWSPRRKGGLPPLYHLPNNENKVHAKNEPRRMQSEGSGAKKRSQVPRKLTVKHRKWRATMKVVSRATVSL